MRSTSRRRLEACAGIVPADFGASFSLDPCDDLQGCLVTIHNTVGDVAPDAEVLAGMRAAFTASDPTHPAPHAHPAATSPEQTHPEATSPPTLQEIVRSAVSEQFAKLWPQVLRAIELRERCR